MMENGRPAEGSFGTYFEEYGSSKFVDSKEKKTNVAGWSCYSGKVDKEGRWHGLGRYMDYYGNIYIGGWKIGRETEGKMYELQEDGSYTLYNVKYNEDQY